MYSILHSGTDSFVEANVLVNGSVQTVAGANTAYFVQLSSMTDLVGASASTMSEIVSEQLDSWLVNSH